MTRLKGEQARLKQGFQSNLDGLIANLKAEPGDIVDLIPSDMQFIGRLASKVAAT